MQYHGLRYLTLAIICAIITLLFPPSVTAAQLRLAWDPNKESDLAGYKVYFGTSSKQYTASVDVGNVNVYVLRGVKEGQTYYIAVTAYDLYFNESNYSIEVNGVAIEPSPPISLVPPTIVPSPIPEPAREPAPIVSKPTSAPTPEPGTPPSPTTEPAPAPTPTPSPVAEPAIGGQVYVAVSEISSEGEAIGNVKRYELNNTNGSTANNTNITSTNYTNIIATNDTNGSTVVQVVDSSKTPILDTNNQIKESSKSAWSSSADGKNVDKGGVGEVLLKRVNPRKILTNIEATNSTNLTTELHEFSTSNEKITPEMLGLSSEDKAAKDKLIQYVQGYDSYAKDKEKTSLQKRKWILGPIVNSRPLVIPYGNSKKVIFVGANDGMLRAFDDATGEELWGFIPSELLVRLKELPQGNGLKYFVDGSPKAYITNSQKIIVFGLRRGGKNYYALDVTKPESPKFLWKIGPETTGFSEIGQTWSEPQFGRIKDGKEGKAVCIIGGGYDENQDRKTPAAEDKKGRAVYVVDLLTGQQIWRWDSKKDPNMKNSIPSAISRVDINGDGYIDRLYVGDMGGKLWRFDLKGSDPNGWSGRVVFNTNPGNTGSVKQKIFHAPDVTLEKGGEIVLFGTGDREHPNVKIGIDKFYAFMDKGNGSPLSEGNLADVTKDFATVQTLANKEGWFISLKEGEKVLAPPVVVFGAVYFSTYTPSQESDGIARIYALNYKVGNPIFNLNPENDQGGPKIDLSDRSKIIGTGIPSGTVISALGKRPVAYTGFPGGLYSTHLKGHSTILPISWKEVRSKK